MARRQFSLSWMSVLAVVALLLAALGSFGVMAFVVGQGGQECGIRLALGAEPRDILGLAFRPGLMLTATGTLVGLGVSVVVLGIATMAAGFIPARRATRVSPLQVLK